MLLHMVADKVASMVADMEVGKVSDKVANIVADMAADNKKWPKWSWRLWPTWR